MIKGSDNSTSIRFSLNVFISFRGLITVQIIIMRTSNYYCQYRLHLALIALVVQN